MGKQPQARKKRNINRHKLRLAKTKNYRKKNLKDLDEIHDTINIMTKLGEQNQIKLDMNEELPGLGKWNCIECSRFFIDEQTLDGHKRSKLHKKRVKNMKETPYSQAEAEAAAGLGSYDIKQKKKDNDLVKST